jgi:hypothetical protein
VDDLGDISAVVVIVVVVGGVRWDDGVLDEMRWQMFWSVSWSWGGVVDGLMFLAGGSCLVSRGDGVGGGCGMCSTFRGAASATVRGSSFFVAAGKESKNERDETCSVYIEGEREFKNLAKPRIGVG